MTTDYSAAIDAVFGPQEEPAAVSSLNTPADAMDTSGGISAALDAAPGMVEQRARETLTPAPRPEAPEFPWSNPTAAWYTPPEEKPAEGISTETLRDQMAEREVMRHVLLPEGEKDDGTGALLRASFMLNAASRYSRDDVFTAAKASADLEMPLDMTLDNLDKARDMLAEYTPDKVKDFAPGFLRLVQYDYDSAILWRHDLATANAVSKAFDNAGEGLAGLSGGLALAGRLKSPVELDPESRAAALDRGANYAALPLAQMGFNLGKLALEGFGALARGTDENYQPANLADKPVSAAILEASGTMGEWVKNLSRVREKIGKDSPLYGLSVWDNPEVLLDSRWWMENTPGVAASMLPILGAYAKGGPFVAGLAGLVMNGNEVYTDLLDAGLEDNSGTRLYSLLGGAAMSALDVVGLSGIFGGKVIAKEAVKDAVLQAATGGVKATAAYLGKRAGQAYLFEGGTEWLQNLVKAGVESAAKGKDFGGILADVGEAAKQLEDFILGGLMGGGIGGVHAHGQVGGERARQRLLDSIAKAAASEEVATARAEVESVVQDNAEAQQRMAFAQSLAQTAEAADASTMHAADPATFEREADKLIPEGARSVWLDVDMVQEFIEEDGARLETLGLTAREVAEALQVQAGAVKVSTARLVSRFDGDERALLLQNARMTPGGMTLTEAQEFDPQKRAEAAAERIRAAGRGTAEIGRERTRLKNEFVQAGYAPHIAEQYATLHAEQARTFADRYGMDPVMLLQERSVVRGEPDDIGDNALYHPMNPGTNLDAPVKVVTVQPRFEGQNAKVLRKRFPKEVRTAVLDEFKAGVINEDTGLKVGMTASDFKEHLKLDDGQHELEHMEAIAALPELMRTARLVESHKDKKPSTGSNLKQVHRFMSALRIGGNEFAVMLTVKEFKDGSASLNMENPVKLYHHRIEKALSSSDTGLRPAMPTTTYQKRDVEQSPSGSSVNINAHEYSLRSLLEDVNDSEGNPFFQQQRGAVSFGPDGRSVTSIFKDASDLSTPIHEGAHVFINDLIRVVMDGGRMAEQLYAREITVVNKDTSIEDSLRRRRQRALRQRWNKHKMGLWQAREDLAALVENANAQREAHGKVIGVDLPPVTLEDALRGQLTQEQIRTLQEVSAAGFEAYMREGKAPSSKLAAVFHKMRQWLAAIYRLAVVHGVKITPEVRRVFDRMLATDDAIRKSQAGAALADEGAFLSTVQEAEAGLDPDESGEWTKTDRINYAPGIVTQETTPGDSSGARRQLVNATAVGIRKPAEAGNGYRKAALNQESEYDRLQELYDRAEADVTARMDKATLQDRNKRWKAYYDEGKEIARGDVFYEIMAALSVEDGNPWSGISRGWLERQYGKEAVADFLKTVQGRRLISKDGGVALDAVGIGDIVGGIERADALGLTDADGLYNYLYNNVVVRRRNMVNDARAYADQRMADDDARAEAAGDEPGEAYRKYLEEVEATVLRLAARRDSGWRTKEQQARWVEEHRTPLADVRRRVKAVLRGKKLRDIQPNAPTVATQKATDGDSNWLRGQTAKETAVAIRKQAEPANGYRQFVGEVRKALQERNAALASGNAQDALAAVDRARVALESWIEANRIVKERQAFEKNAARLAVLKRSVVLPEAWTAIQDMLERFRLAPARKRVEGESVTLSDAVASLCEDTAEINGLPAIAEWLQDDNAGAHYLDLSAEQLQDVKDVLAMLEHMGRQGLAANRESEAAKIQEVAEESAKAMSGLKELSLAREGTAWHRWQGWMRSFFGNMLSSIQWQLRQADGFSNLGPKGRRGVNEERIWGDIVDGEARYQVRMSGLKERLEPIFKRLVESAKSWEAKLGKTFAVNGKPLPVPEIMRRGGKHNWTSDRVLALVLNLGNEGNVQRLREGYPDLSPEALSQLIGDDATRLVFPDWQGRGNDGLLSAQDWRDVQEIGNVLHGQWADIQATHKKMFGFAPRGVEARPLTVRVGGQSVDLEGWYYPAAYDAALSPEVKKRQEQQDAIVRTEAVCAAPAAKRGFTKSRANSGGGAPLLLETGVVMSHLNDVCRFIEMAEIARFADRVTRAPEWAQAYIRAFGRQDYEAIRPNLKGLVLEERPPSDAVSKSADWLRERLVPWGLAFNLKTAVLQSTAVFPAMNDLGASNTMRGISAVAKGGYTLIKEIWGISPYMKSRAANIDQDLRKAMRGIDARTRQKVVKLLGKELTWDDVVEAGMLPLISVDMATSSAIWMAAYNKEMAALMNSPAGKPGIDPSSEHHAAAVRAADMAVKAVNPDFNPSSRSQFLRSRGMARFLNMFSSAVVLFAQRRAYNAAALRQAWGKAPSAGGKMRAALRYARYEMYDFALQGAAMGIILSLAYGEDDPRKWGKNMAGAWLDAAAMRVPVFGSPVAALITGETWRGISAVYDQPWQMAKRASGALHKGSGNGLALSLADIISFELKVPASRLGRNAVRGSDQWRKGEGTPLSVLMPRPGR